MTVDEDYIETRECDFKGEHYSVRDNGAIMRHPKEGGRIRKLDNVWTFGNKDEKTGYLISGGVRVHQVVATAFHGQPEEPNMVVDHKDTNRCNNRPENLSWLTRLENVLKNPFTRKRIELCCGSVEAFLKNPSVLRENTSDPNTKWMRTVSKEEAAKCLKHLSEWAAEDAMTIPQGQGIGDWIFGEKSNKGFSQSSEEKGNEGFEESWDKDWHTREYKSDWQRQKEEIEADNQRYFKEMYGLKDSLTEGAKQLNWKVPSEFPLCPSAQTESPLEDYLAKLSPEATFCRNNTYESKVKKAELSDDKQKLAVITTLTGVTDFALAVITFQDGAFVHENIRSFFTEEGAEKYCTEALGREWTGGDVFEDYC